MPRIYYENFDLVFTRTGERSYEARVMGTPGGSDAFVDFSLEKAPEEVINVVTRNFSVAGGAPAATTPGTGGATPDVGSYLYESVFGGKMLSALTLSLERALGRNNNLRLRLNLTKVPELVGLPWELLTSESNNLALAAQTSVVRYQDISSVSREPEEIRVKPLQMLVVISNPAVPGAGALNVEDEWQRINNALQPLIKQELIRLERLPGATLKKLDERLFDDNKPAIHIFHYIGHGAFDTQRATGQLVFEPDPDDVAPGGATAGFELVDGRRLGQSLAAQSTLQLASINACEGAMVASADSYAGVAQHLLQTANVPVVIAMRKVISDYAAIVFASNFYQWLLVNNLSVDVAMTRARLRMRDAEQKRDPSGTPTEWGTPILFMRNHSGYIVNFQEGRHPVVPPDLPDEVDPRMAKHYQTVMTALTRGKLVPFLGLDVNLFGRQPVENWQPDPGMPILPGYRELVNYLARVSAHPVPFVPALADVSQYALLQYIADEDRGEGTFYSDLMTIFSRADTPTPLHEFWAKVAANNDRLTSSVENVAEDMARRFLIVSNTYDNLLERAFQQTVGLFHVVSYVAHGDDAGKFRHTVHARPVGGTVPVPSTSVIVESGTSYGGLYDRAPVILKLPGTVGDASGLRFAITEDQYLDFFVKRELAGILPTQLLTKLRNSNHLFLGYNVREWSIRALLYRIWDDHKPPQVSWSVPEQPSLVEKSYWEACKVKVIERALSEYLSGLRLSCQTLLPGVNL